MKVLIIDNFDSFTYNLYQYVGELLLERVDSRFCENDVIDVYRNNNITLDQIEKKKYDRIIISPGPGNAADKKYFGICSEVILGVGKKTPILGVCLGMQGIAHYFGGNVIRAREPMHGKTSVITHDTQGVFHHVPQGIAVMRYHSLIVEKVSLPDCFVITATAHDTGEIMGIRHKKYPVEGIQFHPESFATEGGKQLLRNFLFEK